MLQFPTNQEESQGDPSPLKIIGSVENSYPQGCYDPHERARQTYFLEELALGISTRDIKRIWHALNDRLDKPFNCRLYANDKPSSLWTVGLTVPRESYLKNMAGWIRDNYEEIIFLTHDCELPTIHLLVKLWSARVKSHFRETLEIASYSSLNKKDKEGVTPLIKAVQLSNADAVKLLLEFDADPNYRCNRGFTALEHAQSTLGIIDRKATKDLEASRSIIRLLLKSNIEAGYRDPKGRSLFHLAVQHSYSDIIGLLAEDEKEAINCEDIHDQTPLELAVRLSDINSVCELVSSGAITTIRDHHDDDKYDHLDYCDLFDNVVKTLEREGPPEIHKKLHTEYVRYYYKLKSGGLRTAQRTVRNHGSRSIPISRIARNRCHHPRLASQSIDQPQAPLPKPVQEHEYQDNRFNPQQITFASHVTQVHYYLETVLDPDYQRHLEKLAVMDICHCCSDYEARMTYFHSAAMFFYPWNCEGREQCFKRLNMLFYGNLNRRDQGPKSPAIVCRRLPVPENGFYKPPPETIHGTLYGHQRILKEQIRPERQENLEIELAESYSQQNSFASRREYFRYAGLYFHPWDQRSREQCSARLEAIYQGRKRSDDHVSYDRVCNDDHTSHDRAFRDQTPEPHTIPPYVQKKEYKPQLDKSSYNSTYQARNTIINGHRSTTGGDDVKIKPEAKIGTQCEVIFTRRRRCNGHNRPIKVENRALDQISGNTQMFQFSDGDNRGKKERSAPSASERERGRETLDGDGACSLGIGSGNTQGISQKRKGASEPEEQQRTKRPKN